MSWTAAHPSSPDGPEDVRMTGGEAVVRSLAANGVQVVFGIPGTHNLPIYDHLTRYGITHVTTRHEQGAGYAADAFARVTGRVGVVVTTTGPALLNAAAAAGQAYSDSVPVLVISPGMPLTHPGAFTGELHEAKDQRAAMAGVVAHSRRASCAADADALVARCIASCTTGRPRPEHLEIPLDVLASEGPVPAHPARAPQRPPMGTDADLVTRAASLLASARRPALVLGGGARGARRALTGLAERLGALVVTSANGKGVMDETHPLSLGVGLHLARVQRWLAECDVVLAVGTELAASDFWREPPCVGDRLVRIDIDPAQMVRSQRADVALIGDAAAYVDALMKELAARGEDAGGTVPSLELAFGDVRAECRAEAAALGARWQPFLDVVRRSCPADTIFTSDSAMACYYGALGNLAITEEGRFLHPTGFGTLGYALPAGVGAKAAAPDRPVVALSGDGGFQFSLQELATASELGCPVVVIVFDNGGYGEIRAEMEARPGRAPLGVDLKSPDLVHLAAAYGQHGVVADSPDTLAASLTEALARSCVTLIQVPEPTR
jgi:5-guanidino-2-oxopentanoate decarboxylase